MPALCLATLMAKFNAILQCNTPILLARRGGGGGSVVVVVDRAEVSCMVPGSPEVRRRFAGYCSKRWSDARRILPWVSSMGFVNLALHAGGVARDVMRDAEHGTRTHTHKHEHERQDAARTQ